MTTAARCPECAQGKPLNCTGRTYNDADELVTCQGPA